MKKKLTLSVVMLIVVTFFTAATTFAYFTTTYNQKISSDMSLSSAVYPSIVIVNEKDFYLDVKYEDMLESNADSNYPSVEESNDISISVTTSSNGGNYSLDYEIYYEPINTYYKSSNNINNEKEFVVTIVSSIDGKVVDEFNLNDITEEILLYSGTITGSGVEQTFTEVFTVTFGYYNQSFNQNDKSGELFGGNFNIKTEEIIYE